MKQDTKFLAKTTSQHDVVVSVQSHWNLCHYCGKHQWWVLRRSVQW